MPMRVLLIDNYDSFTHNLLQLLATAGADVIVARNDVIDERAALDERPQALCVSPGPGTPADAGVSAALIAQFAGHIPILGVCLGMQVINEVFGGSTVHAPVPVHGKTDLMLHDRTGLFSGLPSPFRAARYHSLCVGRIGNDLISNAHTPDDLCMALRHRALPIFGVQFHPESFMSEYGYALISHFLALTDPQHPDVSRNVHDHA